METNMAVKESIIPTNPADIDKIYKVLDACAKDMQVIEDRKTTIRESVKELSEEHTITVSHLNKMLKTMFKQNYQEVVTTDSEFQLLYETVIDNSSDND